MISYKTMPNTMVLASKLLSLASKKKRLKKNLNWSKFVKKANV